MMFPVAVTPLTVAACVYGPSPVQPSASNVMAVETVLFAAPIASGVMGSVPPNAWVDACGGRLPLTTSSAASAAAFALSAAVSASSAAVFALSAALAAAVAAVAASSAFSSAFTAASSALSAAVFASWVACSALLGFLVGFVVVVELGCQ